MEPQTFEVTAPDGRTLEVSGDHVPTEAELKAIFAAVPGGSTFKPGAMADSLKAGVGGELDTAEPSPLMGALSHAAHPQSVGDMLSLLIPSSVAETASTATRMLKSGVQGASEGKGVAGRLRGFMGGLVNDASGLNAEKANVLRMKTTPNVSGYQPGPVPTAPGEAIPGLSATAPEIPGSTHRTLPVTETPDVPVGPSGHVVGTEQPVSTRPYAAAPSVSFGASEPPSTAPWVNMAQQSMAGRGGASTAALPPLRIGNQVVQPGDPLYQAIMAQLQKGGR